MFEFGHFIDFSFGDSAELLQLLIEPQKVGMDTSSSEWLALLHAHEPIPNVNTVIEAQEYLAKIGQDAQLAILLSPDGNTLYVNRIGEIVRLGNDQMVQVQELCEQGNEAKLNEYVKQMRGIIRNELVSGLSKGAVLQS
jgi:hypothetical protein